MIGRSEAVLNMIVDRMESSMPAPYSAAQRVVILLALAAAGVATYWMLGRDAKIEMEQTEIAHPEATRRVYSSADEVEQLASLPYAERSFDPEARKRGVTLHDPSKAFQGYSFFTSRDLPAAFLIDMEGNQVHRWRRREGKWQHATLLPNGEVLALIKEQKLIKVGLDSELIWSWQGNVHHDLWPTPEGEIYVLTRRSEWRPEIHRRHPILSDYLTVLDEDGNLLREISILDLVSRSPYSFLLPSIQHRVWEKDDLPPEKVELDFLHTNHVEVFDGSQADQFRYYERGNALLSLRHLNLIGIADLDKGELVWAWGPTNLTRPHHPTVLPSGNLLIFNNGKKKPSQVLELDPRSGEIVWDYGKGTDFFSASRGSNIRLPNGNTLITESDPGYVFEVTAQGEVVWEFANPQVNKKDERSAIWRMYRFTEDQLPFLGPSESSRGGS